MLLSGQSGPGGRQARLRRPAVARAAIPGGWRASFLIYFLTGLLVIGAGTAVAAYLPIP